MLCINFSIDKYLPKIQNSYASHSLHTTPRTCPIWVYEYGDGDEEMSKCIRSGINDDIKTRKSQKKTENTTFSLINVNGCVCAAFIFFSFDKKKMFEFRHNSRDSDTGTLKASSNHENTL